MSISNQTEIINNPANQIFRWKGSAEANEGNFLSVYDTETKTVLQLEEVSFIILDQLACISGYSPKYDGSIWSNEVHSTVKETLKLEVRDKEKKQTVLLKEGTYQQIKEIAVANGGKYTKVIYALLLDENNKVSSPVPVRIYLSGSSLAVYSEISPRDGDLIKISNKGTFSPKAKGKVAFYPPKIEILNSALMTPELKSIAFQVDQVLQSFFKNKGSESEINESSSMTTPVKDVDAFGTIPHRDVPPQAPADLDDFINDLNVTMPF